MAKREFESSVFINCPFDADFAPILQAILFTITYLGFRPRIATEDVDAAQVRVAKILRLIRESRYSIHDLSRARAKKAGEFYRLNMPFELGLDYGCKEYLLKSKRLLILQELAYRHQAALSDLAGCDTEVHNGDHQVAIRKVRNWLVAVAGAQNHGAAKIAGAYADFQEWHYERQLAAGFDDKDIQDYPTAEMLSAMTEWVALGKPI